MNKAIIAMILLVGLGFVGGLLPRAAADEWDQKTIFTFSGPVEIPGQVLPAGTYVFKLANSDSDRNLVQVFSEDEKHLYGTFLAVPDQSLAPADKPIITFEERAADSPEAVKAWFYPGDDYGHAFVYPKPKAAALANANNTPVPSMPAELAANTTKPAQTMDEPHIAAMSQASVEAQPPTEDQVDIADAFTGATVPPENPPSDIQADAQADAEPLLQPDIQADTQVDTPADTQIAQDSLPSTLPSTGSSLPLIGLIGLFSLGSALGLRVAAAKAK